MMCDRITLLCVFFILIYGTSKSAAHNMQEVCGYKKSEMLYQMIGKDTSTSSVERILDFFEDHIDELKFPKHEELVFVIGSKESNRTTLALFLTDAEIEAVETYPCSDDYVYIDKDGPLNDYPPHIHSELIPQLIEDKAYGTEFYILPEYRITDDVKIDVTAAHLVQRLINFAESIKFLFTLSYSSMGSSGSTYESRKEIRDLAKRATNLIKDIDKYSGAMSLVVTNYENNPNVPDSEASDAVVSALQYTINDFVTANSGSSITPNEKEVNKKCIRFLEILLEYKTGGTHPRLTVFRLANETGLVAQVKYLQDEKVEIKAMIREATHYIEKRNSDFYYEVSSETKKRINDILDEVKNRISLDVIRINEEIERIYKQFEEDNADIYVLHDQMKRANEVMSEVFTSDPKIFVQQVISSAAELEIEISKNVIDDILKHIEFADFLMDIKDSNRRDTYQISNGALESTKFLNESKAWYEFLMELHDTLSEYKIQEKVKEYEKSIGYVMQESAIKENEKRSVKDIGLKDFLESVGINISSKVENLQADSIKLEKLSALLQQTMYEYGTQSCSPKRLVVKGYNIKISDVVQMKCSENVEFKEIFALNKVIVDRNMEETGKIKQLVIIAPTWEIIGDKRITLNGYNAKEHNPNWASDGTDQSVHGKPGLPGKPGGSAGCFIAVGKKFIRDEHLNVDLKGGAGGAGQHGGSGRNGKNGEDPPIPKQSCRARDEWNSKQFLNHALEENIDFNIFFARYMRSTYEVFGKPYYAAGNGGDGGIAGIGGLGGKTLFVGIERQPKFVVSNASGIAGTFGFGGRAGLGARDGNTYKIRYVDAYFLFDLKYHEGKILNTKTTTHAGGNRGRDNKNGDVADPEPVFLILTAETINNYKSFIRENLPKNIAESSLRAFMNDVEANKEINSLYGTMSLFQELKELENQYLHLRYKISFIPFYESLANRIDEYTKVSNNSISTDEMKVLRFVYTTALGKISNIRNFRNHIAITDLSEYLEIVQKNIGKMTEIDKAVNIEEQKQQYQNAMMDKVQDAAKIIDEEILPALVDSFGPLGQKILELIDEVVYNREQAKIAEQELNDKIMRQQIIGGLAIVGKVLECFGGVFTAIGTALEASLGAIEQMVKMFQAMHKLVPTLTRKINNLLDYFKEGFHVFLDQLNFMKNILSGRFEILGAQIEKCIQETNEFISIQGKVVFPIAMKPCRLEISNIVKGLIESHKLNVPEFNETNQTLDSVTFITKEDGDSYKGEDAAAKADLERIEKTNDLTKATKEVWDAVKESNDKLDKLHQEQMDLENQINKWNHRLEQIQEKLLPMFLEVQNTILKIASSLDKQTAVQLDISAWKTQTVLGDIKLLVNQMSSGTSLEDDLKRLVEKIEESFGTLIKVHERIQSYIDQSEFAGYLANINSPNSQGIADPQLNNAVSEMKKILQSNVVLEQYEVAIHSFKQHYFPFAAIHLSNFDLPTGLKATDTDVLVRRASEEVNYLQEQVKFLGASIGKFDGEIFGDIDFESDNINIAVPFYVFKSREFKYENRKLLSGEDVIIKADITNGLNQNSIKFNQIGIRFKLSDEKMQKELDSELDNFGVRMTMIGHNYYQCGKKFYYLSVDDRITIEYSFKKDANGKPRKFNEVYRKLSEKQYFLSPYAMWKVQLIVIAEDFALMTDAPTKNAFDKLKQFGKETINLELIGRGQYFRNNGASTAEVCTIEMDKFYDFDSSTSYVNSVDGLKSKYSF